MSSLFAKYVYLLDKYPLVTKGITGGVIASISDLLCQILEQSIVAFILLIEYITKQKKAIDWVRNARFTGINMLVISPLYHYYTAALLPRILPVTTKMSLVRKLFVDQTLGASFFTSVFFIGMSLFEGKSVQNGVDNLQNKFWYTLKNNWLLWPAANAINFSVIPLKFQVLYFNFVCIFWNIFLSYAQNVYKPAPKAA